MDHSHDKKYVDKCEADTTGNGTACCTCPDGAECEEGSTIETIKLRPSFYRHSPQTPQVLACTESWACPGELDDDDEGDDDGAVEEDEDIYNPCAEGMRPNRKLAAFLSP